jgi:hypothetical protein
MATWPIGMHTDSSKVERKQMSDTNNISEILASEAERMEREVDVPRSYVPNAAPRNPSQVYSIRIPVELLEELRRLAAVSRVPTTAMLRQWILERLDVETVAAERQAAMSSQLRHDVHLAISQTGDGPDASALQKQLRHAIGMRPAA